MRTILTTTGTSLLSNAKRHYAKNDLSDTDLRMLFNQVSPSEASAETNSLLKVGGLDDHVVLFHTMTEEGKRCAECVKQYLDAEGWKHVRLRKLSLTQDEKHLERDGLRDLVNKLIEEIIQAQKQNHEVIINATGGFKAEIAYTTMVGMAFQVPIKYIYEKFEQPVTFPPLPIHWNLDLLVEYEFVFNWLDEQPRTQVQLSDRLQGIPAERQMEIKALLLPPDDSNEIFLSPAGEVLWKRFRQQKDMAATVQDAPPSTRPPGEKLASSLDEVKHHYPKGSKLFAEKLAQLEPVIEIIGGNFENIVMKRVKSVSEDGIIRILWADNNKAVNMTLRTTALGYAQTLKFCDKYVRPLLD